MARDDYHVIVYQILAYLYQQLKKGLDVDPKKLEHNSNFLSINMKYWQYIMISLLEEGYIKGIVVEETIDGMLEIYNLGECQITPKGIEYLTDNSTINKAKEFFKDLKDVIPFV